MTGLQRFRANVRNAFRSHAAHDYNKKHDDEAEGLDMEDGTRAKQFRLAATRRVRMSMWLCFSNVTHHVFKNNLTCSIIDKMSSQNMAETENGTTKMALVFSKVFVSLQFRRRRCTNSKSE
jgi:hypothetical protein